jgi:hypothetical protein
MHQHNIVPAGINLARYATRYPPQTKKVKGEYQLIQSPEGTPKQRQRLKSVDAALIHVRPEVAKGVIGSAQTVHIHMMVLRQPLSFLKEGSFCTT